MSDADPSSLTTELLALRERVAPHWRDYIDARLTAPPTDDDPEPLATCLEWVRRYATIDGVQGDGWDGRYYVPPREVEHQKPKRGGWKK